MQIEVTKKRFTVDEYYKMGEAGILTREDRTELVDGEIIMVIRMGSRHASVISRVTCLFVELFNRKAILRAQLPFRLDEFNEFEPDMALFKKRDDSYASAHPGPSDALLVLEISDTSLKYDRDMKLPAYAAAGVPEVWIADLRGDSLLVYRDPSNGKYKSALSFRRGDSITCPAFPDIQIPVQELLA